MHFRSLIATIATGLLCFVMTAPAAQATGQTGASFLEIPVGAGPAALGSAYSAAASDAYATVWNPAGLGFSEGTQLAGQHLSYLDTVHDEFLGAAFPLSGTGKALGVSAQYLGTGDINATDLAGGSLGTYSTHYGAYSMAYGQRVTDHLALGLAGKWINAQIAGVSGNAYAADLGSLYRVNNQWSLAATLTNLGSRLGFLSESDPLPLSFHMATAYSPNAHWSFLAEGVYPRANDPSGRVGVQWKPFQAISLRTGYRTDSLKQLSPIAGFSTGIGLEFWGQEFSYAWLPYGDLGDTQYFSLLFKFGGSAEPRKNLIQYRTPKNGRVSLNQQKAASEKSDPEALSDLLAEPAR